MSRLLIKICGVTTPEDALLCAEAGADAIGINFWPGSSRCCTLAQAGVIAAALAARYPAVLRVGVFVNASSFDRRAARRAADLHALQLHGDEPPDLPDLSEEAAEGPRWPYWKGLRLSSPADLTLLDQYAQPGWEGCVIDAPSSGYGGSGQRLDLELAAAAARRRPVLLAGGLRPDNVAEAVRRVCPAGVDVASGVESAPGRKDGDAVRAFIAGARQVLRHTL